MTDRLKPRRGFSRGPKLTPDVTVWVSADGLLVTSAIHNAVLPGSNDEVGPQWLLVVSRSKERRLRASDADVMRVVETFEMPSPTPKTAKAEPHCGQLAGGQ